MAIAPLLVLLLLSAGEQAAAATNAGDLFTSSANVHRLFEVSVGSRLCLASGPDGQPSRQALLLASCQPSALALPGQNRSRVLSPLYRPTSSTAIRR